MRGGYLHALGLSLAVWVTALGGAMAQQSAPLFRIQIAPNLPHVELTTTPAGEASANTRVMVKVKLDPKYGLRRLFHREAATGGYQTDISEYSFLMPAYDVELVAQTERIYTITLDPAVTNGTVECIPSTDLFKGTKVLVSAKPATAYRLKPGSLLYKHGVESYQPVVNGELVMPDADVEITAEFERDENVRFEVKSDETYGQGVVLATPFSQKPGGMVTVRLFPPHGKAYKEGTLRWCRGLKPAADPSEWNLIVKNAFVMPESHVYVTADFEDDGLAKYSVHVADCGVPGVPIVATPSAKLREGAHVTLTITAPDNYDRLFGTLEMRSLPDGNWVKLDKDEFDMPAADVEVRCQFKEKPNLNLKYNVTFDRIENGAVQSASGQMSFFQGAQVVLRVRNLKGYKLVPGSLTYEPVTGGPAKPIFFNEGTQQYAFKMPAHDVLIRARFERVYTAGVWSGHDPKRGTILVSPKEELSPGQRVEISIVQLPGFFYVEGSLEWSEDGGDTWKKVTNGELFMPAADVLVRASFALQGDPDDPNSGITPPADYCRVNVEVQGEGTLHVSSSTGEEIGQVNHVAKGTTLSISAEAAEGYSFDLVLVNGKEHKPSTLVVEGDVVIIARFSRLLSTSVRDGARVRVWPNPFRDLVQVRGRGLMRVELLRMDGASVLHTEGVDAVTLRTVGIPAGLYVLRVVSHDGAQEELHQVVCQ